MSSLAGLVNYGDSDDEHDDGSRGAKSAHTPAPSGYAHDASAAIHPPPIPHCPWSACYDEGSGFTYYWNQQTNAVTWEAPPEYLLALKLAQQHLTTSGSAEVSAEEWQLYQQALAEKQNSQNKMAAKAAITKPTPKTNDNKLNSKDKRNNKDKKNIKAKKRPASDDDEEKIELITSYYNSDSESNDEAEAPVKPLPPKPPVPEPRTKPVVKKFKKQALPTYGPSLPSNQNYSMPIGPELPPNMVDVKMDVEAKCIEEKKSPKPNENEDSQDESILLSRLKDKAMLLEKLGGEIPSDLQKIIRDGSRSGTASPKPKEKVVDTNIDDLLEEIEKKELPKVKSGSKNSSAMNSPRSDTPPRDEIKPLFPSAKVILEEEVEKPCLFSSVANIQENGIDKEKPKPPSPPLPQEKKNMYLPDTSEVTVASRKKLRISNSVLPDRSKSEISHPSYTTKYSAHIEGFSSERTGLGFSQDEEGVDSPKATTISYGNGLMFTKGETLNEDKKDEEFDDLMDLVEAKLKHLNELQPCIVTPIQEMLIQMQTLCSAFRVGALDVIYCRRWVRACASALATHEARAAPAGWRAAFQRSAGRYRYERESDGFVQWEYPAPPADMDICTTPPHPSSDKEDIITQPPLPPLPPLPPAPPPAVPPPPRPRTPPPPSWSAPDPPPPGCDDPPPLPPPPPPPPPIHTEPPKPKQEIGDELASFYSDLAEIEKYTAPPLPPPPPSPPSERVTHTKDDRDKDKEKDKEKSKKKTKVKISSAVGMKHKSVSSLVAKWQQVADEINSD